MSNVPDVECPVCGVAPRERCRTLKTKRTTDTHTKRFDAWFTARIRLREVPEVCSCGNRFDAPDNMCMISACQMET